MENLSDDLLIEIYSRLPYKTTLRCKSISKRFFNLISNHIFIERSILHHHKLLLRMNHHECQKEWRLCSLSRRKKLVLFLPHNIHGDLSFNPQNHLSLSFLGPKFDSKSDEPPPTRLRNRYNKYSKIVGFSNGLFLCRKSPHERLYFVCNPLTKKSLKVVPIAPPLRGQNLLKNSLGHALEGFLCEPYYNIEGNIDLVSVNNSVQGLRFRIVRIPLFEGTVCEFLRGIKKSEFEVVIFSSETGQWTTKLVSCRNGSSFTRPTILSDPVAHGGKLYFMGKENILVYDPFCNENECNIIEFPGGSDRRNICYTGHVGVSCGKIRLSCFSSFSSLVKVWELNEEKNGWCLLHEVCVPAQDESSVRDELRGREGVYEVGYGVFRVRGFHPYHGDVVLFQFNHRIFYGNLKTKEFQTIGYGTQDYYSLQIISLDLPLWPTPLPSTFGKFV
ncbi:hypothetical protein HN51_063297 [Arachis hypogaea]|uniref:uncharacterized protein LOC107612597 n=1 Tax=Arachis ipaensis TaxID=130454 RepID=UPI0007AF469F|nr:uncharacterized protein LOC107612597 [Arachis ipaensis]